MLGKRTACALADQRIFAEQSHAARIVRPMGTVAFDAHIAGGDTNDRALVVIEHFGCRKARIDFHAKFFSLGAKPAADIAKRHNIITVIVHQRRHGEIRQAHRSGRPQHKEMIRCHRRLEGVSFFFTPSRQKLVYTYRINNSARKNMRTNFPALFKHNDGKFRVRLFQTDSSSKARRTRADNHDVEFHAFALGKLLICIFWGFRHSSLRPVSYRLLNRITQTTHPIVFVHDLIASIHDTDCLPAPTTQEKTNHFPVLLLTLSQSWGLSQMRPIVQKSVLRP